MRPEYNEGQIERMSGKGKDACPYGFEHMSRRSFWLAGWHDADMIMRENENPSQKGARANEEASIY